MLMAQGATQQVTKQETITSATEGFDALLARAEQVAGRLEAVCDRINGSRPREASQNESPAQPTSSVIDAIQRRRHRLSVALSMIESHLDGVERGL